MKQEINGFVFFSFEKYFKEIIRYLYCFFIFNSVSISYHYNIWKITHSLWLQISQILGLFREGIQAMDFLAKSQ